MTSSIDGVPVMNKNAQRKFAKQAMKAKIVASLGLPSVVAIRMAELEGKLQRERQLRIRTQQELSGCKSAVVRLQSIVARYRAAEAEQKARTFEAEVVE